MQHRTGPQGPASRSELSDADVELIARAKLARQAQVVPDEMRRRLLARTLEQAEQARIGLVPAAELVAIAPRRLNLALGWAAAMALGVVLVANLRGAPDEAASEAPALGQERSAQRQVENRLFQSELFRAPAPLLGGPPPAARASLLGERPFAENKHAWQVRRWPNLSADPVEPAEHEFEGGALCVTLGAQERVIGGWPWPSPGGVQPQPVALTAGKAYRLVFQAWANEPEPSQLLVAVGHSALPFSTAGGARVPVSSERQFFEVRFVAPSDDPSVGVAFLATNGSEPTRVCVGEMTLTEAAPR